MHSARALDEDDVAFAEIFLEPLSRGFGIGKKQRSHSSPACRRRQVLGIAAHADNEIQSGFGGGFSAGGMQCGACSPSSSISPATRMRRRAGRAARVRIMERSASGLEL